ncbi:hypothetical protein TYRP_013805 [Tyrophagus putrescentiae]|nr:hypothetical protein TYRP_013805 [Tyrophagus putrescentiae]
MTYLSAGPRRTMWRRMRAVQPQGPMSGRLTGYSGSLCCRWLSLSSLKKEEKEKKEEIAPTLLGLGSYGNGRMRLNEACLWSLPLPRLTPPYTASTNEDDDEVPMTKCWSNVADRENVDDERGEEGGGEGQSAGAAVLFVVGEEVGQGEAAAQADQVGGEGDQGEDGLRNVGGHDSRNSTSSSLTPFITVD